MAEIKFPVIAHHKIIVDATRRDDAATAAAFRGFDLVEPIAAGRSSNGGKCVSYGVSVRLKDRAEMARFDACLPLVPGLRMVL